MSFSSVSPVIRVSDYQKARSFYSDVLGFDVVEEAGDPVIGFGILRSGKAQIFLHAWDGAEAEYNGWRAYFYADDLATLEKRLHSADVRFQGPKVSAYGMRELEVADPDGNVLCFAEDAA